MTFVGASPDVDVRGLAKLRPYVNFFLGDDPDRWRSRVPTFDSVLYEGLYAGVDVELHRRQGRIEYDFILAPGVDPSVVRVRFGGASSIELDSSGAMLLSTFVRAGSAESGIKARCWGLALDPDEIDPTRVDVWLTGDLKDAGPGDDFHLTPNAFQASFAGGALSTDGFVVGLDETFSSVLYGSYLGGELDDVGLGIDVYPDSKIAVVGQTRSTAFPIANAHQPVHGGQADGFYMRIDPAQSLPSATLVCSSYFGGAQDAHLTDVVSDATGRDLYLTGSSEWPGSVTGWPGPTIPATVSGLDVNHGGLDTVLATVKGFDLTFLVFLGGSGDDVAHAIDLDFGSVTMAGSTVFDVLNPQVHFYAVLDNVDLAPGNGDPPGFQTTPLGGEAYTPGTIPVGFLAWPNLDQPAEMDAFVLRFDTP